jgi:hypothetical protein
LPHLHPHYAVASNASLNHPQILFLRHLYCCCLQAPGLLQTLQRTVAEPDDIFYVNFGRWHFNNCKGLQSAPYKQSLWNLGKLYEVWTAVLAVMLRLAHLPGHHRTV